MNNTEMNEQAREVQEKNAIKCNDFMFFESYMATIDDIREISGEKDANELLMEIIHYGVTGKRNAKLTTYLECVLCGILPQIDKSKESKNKAVKDAINRQKRLRNSKKDEQKKP